MVIFLSKRSDSSKLGNYNLSKLPSISVSIKRESNPLAIVQHLKFIYALSKMIYELKFLGKKELAQRWLGLIKGR